jgi:hypothetical protein
MEKQKLGLFTISEHTLESKLSGAANHGFAGVEMFYTDLVGFAESQGMSPP